MIYMKTTRDMMKKATADAQRAQAASGVILRAQTFKNKKREAARKACRGKVAW